MEILEKVDWRTQVIGVAGLPLPPEDPQLALALDTTVTIPTDSEEEEPPEI